jgi:hypothetical protein
MFMPGWAWTVILLSFLLARMTGSCYRAQILLVELGFHKPLAFTSYPRSLSPKEIAGASHTPSPWIFTHHFRKTRKNSKGVKIRMPKTVFYCQYVEVNLLHSTVLMKMGFESA